MTNEVKLNLSLSIDEVNTVLAGVSNLAFHVASPLIDNIRNQAVPQLPEQPEQPEQPVAESTEAAPQLLTEAE